MQASGLSPRYAEHKMCLKFVRASWGWIVFPFITICGTKVILGRRLRVSSPWRASNSAPSFVFEQLWIGSQSTSWRWAHWKKKRLRFQELPKKLIRQTDMSLSYSFHDFFLKFFFVKMKWVLCYVAWKTLRRSYRLANFFGIIVVFDHAVNIISQFAVILDVLNAARMYFVTHAFGWTMLTLEHISQTLIFVVL